MVIIVLSFSNGTMDGRQSFGSRRVAEAAIHSGRDGIIITSYLWVGGGGMNAGECKHVR